MAVDRETKIEVAVTVATVGLFIAAVLAIGATSAHGQLGAQGAFSIIGLIVGFIVLMTAAGYWLSAREE